MSRPAKDEFKPRPQWADKLDVTRMGLRPMRNKWASCFDGRQSEFQRELLDLDVELRTTSSSTSCCTSPCRTTGALEEPDARPPRRLRSSRPPASAAPRSRDCWMIKDHAANRPRVRWQQASRVGACCRLCAFADINSSLGFLVLYPWMSSCRHRCSTRARPASTRRLRRRHERLRSKVHASADAT